MSSGEPQPITTRFVRGETVESSAGDMASHSVRKYSWQFCCAAWVLALSSLCVSCDKKKK